MNQPKVSIVIPIYNVAPYLRDTLDSVRCQSLEDIEIICVDDCSTDECLSIIRAYAEADPRIKVIAHSSNMTASQSRKDGVLASTGKYIMFLDGDDCLYPDSCQIAYAAIEKYKTDIVHFECHVNAVGDVDEQRIKDTKKAADPFIGTLNEEENLLKPCWEEKKFGIGLWSKIYNGELCRKAFQYIEDGRFPKAQDLYAFFVISFFAKTYYGIPDVLYSYKLGSGISGETFLTLYQFQALVLQKNVLDALERFTKKNLIFEESYVKRILKGLHSRFLNAVVWNWLHHLRKEDKSEAWHMMAETWGKREIIQNLARFWNQREFLAEQFSCVDDYGIPRSIVQEKGKKLTIGIYYFKMRNGGAERVCVTLANLFARIKDKNNNYKYNVVLISDTGPDENDYETDKRVFREFLPPFDTSTGEKYIERYDGWQDIITRNHLDLIISGLWVAPAAFWDIISIRCSTRKCLYIMHQHSFSCIPNKFLIMKPSEVAKDYTLCDGVVTLSEADRLYVASYNRHVYFIPNPSEVNLQKNRSRYEKDTIIWVARLSEEKNPLAVLKMMRYVSQSCPEAVLYIIGAGESSISDKMNQYIDQYGLADHVKMVGFTKNVEKYYQAASVFVCTSDFEGYSLTFGEALSYGVPIVTFDMPWFCFIQDGRGIVTVPHGRIDMLANKVSYLLQHTDKIKELGRQGRELTEHMSNDIILSYWEHIWQNGNAIPDTQEVNPDLCLLIRSINQFNKKGGEIQTRDVWMPLGSRQNQINRLNEELESLRNSISFRIGRGLTFIPRKIRDIFYR